MLLAHLHQVFHLVFAVFTVVVLEVEIFGHQGVQSQHIQQMIDVVPLGPVLLIQLVFLHAANYRLTEGFNQGT